MAYLTNLDLREQMIGVCLEMNRLGINQGTSGNASARVSGGFLITPSGVPYERIKPQDIVEMDFDGSYDGPMRPSSEWRFHRDILKHRDDVDVVLHNHAVFATTLAVHHMDIPSFHYMIGVAGGNTIRCAPYATFGTQALSDHALAALQDRYACLLGQHGLITIAKTFEKALWLAVEVETLAKMYVHALSIGKPPVLSDEEMDRVRRQMQQMSYGQAPDLDGVADVPHRRDAEPEAAE